MKNVAMEKNLFSPSHACEREREKGEKMVIEEGK